nr:2-C-methyl-D-erythritol 4-phosphate cytidylyltransferase [Kineosphaera limosa]
MVLAAGSGSRFGAPKQFLDLGGLTLLDRTIATLAPLCTGVVVALPLSDTGHTNDGVGNDGAQLRSAAEHVRRVAEQLRTVAGRAQLRTVAGGRERADSVRAALAAIPPTAQVIIVADAAHPLASGRLVRAVIGAVREGADGAFPGLPLTEVLADVDTAGVRRAGLERTPPPPAATRVLVQTPQAFDAAAFRLAHSDSPAAAEDSALVAASGGRIVAVPGEPTNLHVTTPAELDLARLIVAAGP